MQKRFWLKTFTDIHDAYEYKKGLLKVKENKDNVYQVRKGRDGGREVFRLVQRFATNEARVVNETKRNNKRKRSLDVSGATS